MVTKKFGILVFLILMGVQNLVGQAYQFTVYNMANTPVFTTNSFKAAAIGKSNSVWIGSANQGIYRFNGNTWIKLPVLTTHNIRGLAVSPIDSTTWVANTGTNSTYTNGGVHHILDTLTYSFTYYGSIAGLPTRAGYGIAVEPDNTAWSAHIPHITASVVTGGGIGKIISGQTSASAVYAGLPNGNWAEDARCLSIGLGSSQFWVGVDRSCYNGNCKRAYIARYNLSGGFIDSIGASNSPIPFTNVPGGPLARAIDFDANGRAWVGLSTGGLAVLNSGSWVMLNSNINFPPGAAVNFQSICHDTLGKVFIGTTLGLFIYNGGLLTDTASYALYDISDGLPSSNIAGVATGKNNVIWLASGAGVVKMAPGGGSPPTQPSAIGGLSIVCQDSLASYNIAPVSGATSYTWTKPSGWSGNSTSTSITFVVGENSGVLSVTANNSYGSSPPRTLSVTVHPILEIPGPFTGSDSVCQNSSNNIYSVPVDPGATSYVWTFPSGWSGASTTNSIALTSDTVGGIISVKAVNPCHISPVRSTEVHVKRIPAQPDTVTGPDSVCQNSYYTYSVAAVQGVTSYTWTVPAGWSGFSSTNSIYVGVGVNGGSLSVKANNACGNSPSKTKNIVVLSIPAQPDSIEGPDSVCEGVACSYSIAPVSGATYYSWFLPSGWSGNSTTPSVSVTPGTTGGIISVVAKNAKCSGLSKSMMVTVSATPVQPGAVSGNEIPCQATNQVYSVPNTDGTAYNWSFPAGWSQIGGSTSNSVTVSVGGNPGNITVTPSNICGSGPPRTLAVVPFLVPSQPGPITGSNIVCQNVGQLYSISPVSNATSYTWTLPLTWGGSSTTNSISAFPGQGSGVISVYANNNICPGPSQSLTVSVITVPAQPGSVSGDSVPCLGSSKGYSVPGVAGVTYIWVFPTGWVKTSGGNTNSVVVTVGSGSGNIVVTPSNMCGSGASRTRSVTVKTIPSQPGSISGNTGPCQGTSQTYSVPNVSNVSYSWTFPSGWTVPVGVTGNSITVTAGANPGNIMVTPSNSCGNGTARILSVSPLLLPLQPGAISGNLSPCEGSSQIYSVTIVSGVIYNWSFPSGWTQTGGGTSNSVTFLVGFGSGVLQVTPSNGCGNGNASSSQVTVNPRPVPVITGPGSACAGSTGNVYTTTSGMSNYQWVVSSGGTVTAGGTSISNSVTITWNTSGSKTISLNYTNSSACTALTPTVKSIFVSAIPPPLVQIPNTTVLSGQSICWSASNVLTAGGPGMLVVQSGGSATLVAGSKILMLPVVRVYSGGYMHAYITTQCLYCSGPNKVVEVLNSLEPKQDGFNKTIYGSQSFFVYPNPTQGIFTLEISGTETPFDGNVEVYSSLGEKILAERLTDNFVYTFSLEGKLPGIYFLRIISGEKPEILKIIKQ